MVMVVIVSKWNQPKSSAASSSLTINLYPPTNPQTFSMYSDGTLPFLFLYNVCVALDSVKGDFTYVTPNGNVPLKNLIDAFHEEQEFESFIDGPLSTDQVRF
ncbi:hypothetical protein GDO81_010819 [Engystomops pustulosus]|uniref:Uncharacterized protein n=1 Tax=Engystomops pustulosus TaxID=76066 RepID=A0AAV7C2Y5_ENGPU|nr:hypothetical protein GDO81_010819 [Engystomops pustulosus]